MLQSFSFCSGFGLKTGLVNDREAALLQRKSGDSPQKGGCLRRETAPQWVFGDQTTPWAYMASATFRKPAMFAPAS